MAMESDSIDTERARVRERLYSHYLSDAGTNAPRSVAEFAPRAAMLRHAIRTWFPPDRSARILDLGCGSGALIHFARELGYTQVAGVDTSPEQVRCAHALGLTEVSEGDLLETLRGTEDSSLDCVVALDVLEHLTRAECLSLADEVHRVLRPGGRWIIHVPNGEGLFGMRIRYGDLTHEIAFTRGSMQQLLAAAGFSRVACFEDRPVVHGLKSGARWIVWMGVRACLRLALAAETGDLGRSALFTQNLFAVATKGHRE